MDVVAGSDEDAGYAAALVAGTDYGDGAVGAWFDDHFVVWFGFREVSVGYVDMT